MVARSDCHIVLISKSLHGKLKREALDRGLFLQVAATNALNSFAAKYSTAKANNVPFVVEKGTRASVPVSVESYQSLKRLVDRVSGVYPAVGFKHLAEAAVSEYLHVDSEAIAS